MRFAFVTVGSLLLLAACTAQQATILTEPIRIDKASVSSSSIDSLPSSPRLDPSVASVSSDSPARSERSDRSGGSDATVSSAPDALPPSVRIVLPFATQAPTGDWGDPFQEACEEASLILVHHYLSKQPLDISVMQQSILDLVEWETLRGLPQDIRIEKLAIVAREYYGYESTIVENTEVTTERIEAELAQGIPVIVPLAGRMLGNPYYSGDGPPYHMLVIVGYDAKNFLTHDVGTRRGEYYSYRKSVIMDAIHDWTGSKETIENGEKRMMIVRYP